MSELSTVAIKDGHRGHLPHHSHQPMNEERADRISRLAGLERVGGAFGGQPTRTLTPSGAAGAYPSQTIANPTQGYFDANNQPQIFRERSTVGSASATGSVGGRTTWASGSDMYDADKMSEDTYPDTTAGDVDTQAGDADTSSMGGFSDEAASLVGFGEGARTPARQTSVIGSPVAGKSTPSAVPAYLREQAGHGVPASPFSTQSTPSAERQDPRMIDGMTYDPDVMDTTTRPPPPTGESGAETTERILRERRGREGLEDGRMS